MINNIKDLAKVIKLCRSTGVAILKIGDLELQLGPTPKAKDNTKLANFGDDDVKIPKPNLLADETPDTIETEELTEEQRLFYSVSEPEGNT